jgi:hypothetical protein
MIPVIKILAGLFIWILLPQLLVKKRRRSPYKRFVRAACAVAGISVIGYGVMDLIQLFIDF